MTNQNNELDTPYSIALDCYHAGSMARAGKTINEATVKEWTDRIQALVKQGYIQGAQASQRAEKGEI